MLPNLAIAIVAPAFRPAMASSVSSAGVSAGPDVLQASTASISTVPADVELSENNLFVYILLTMLRWLPGSLFWLITFLTITLPTWMFTIFSTTLTISLNATTVYDPMQAMLNRQS
jgi:lysophospholipid hydrolase